MIKEFHKIHLDNNILKKKLAHLIFFATKSDSEFYSLAVFRNLANLEIGKLSGERALKF